MPLFASRRANNFIGFNDYGKFLGRRSEGKKPRFSAFTRYRKDVKDKIQENEPPPPHFEVPETNDVLLPEVPETNDVPAAVTNQDKNENLPENLIPEMCEIIIKSFEQPEASPIILKEVPSSAITTRVKDEEESSKKDYQVFDNKKTKMLLPPKHNNQQKNIHHQQTPRTARIASVHASCCDVRHPVNLILNKKDGAFWATTGLYPQSTEVSFETIVHLTELDLVCCPEIIRLSITCLLNQGDSWQDVAVVDTVYDQQKKYHNATKNQCRRHLRFTHRQPPLICRRLRLCIERAATDFAFVRHLRVVGIPVSS